jgi:hypothetical protein
VPVLSLVVPTYEVAPYLPEFLASLDAQGPALDEVEIVFVDDGSTDGSARLVGEWVAAAPGDARVVTQENRGLCEARNTGLREVHGDWVSFPDPDDRLTAGYLATVIDALRSVADSTTLVVTELVRYWEADDRVEDVHPLRSRFRGGPRTVSPDVEPDVIHLAANTGFYRVPAIRQHGLEFDARVVPSFEDAHFTARYRVLCPGDVLLLAGARYEYRSRAAQTSLTQTSMLDPRRYLVQPRFGGLGALQFAVDHLGHVPEWLQNTVLYELAWYFRREEQEVPITDGLAPDVLAQFRDLLREIFALIEPDVVWAFSVLPLSDRIRAAMVALTGETVGPWGLVVSALDDRRRVARVAYLYTGTRPRERFRLDDVRVEPRYATTAAVEMFGATALHRRVVWLPALGRLSATLDNQRLTMWVGLESRRPLLLRRRTVWTRWRDVDRPVSGRGPQGRPVPPPDRVVSAAEPDEPAARRGRFRLRVPRRPGADRKHTELDGAWLLTDGVSAAGGNAEHLYRYLRAERPRVNAWFALDPSSPDWGRLAAEGFRLVAHGSSTHLAALLRTSHLVTSSLDPAVLEPVDRQKHGPTDWRVTYLPDRVVVDDESHVLNALRPDLLVTSSVRERGAMIDEDTPYELCSREVRAAGRPRHDALLAAAQSAPAATRTAVTLAVADPAVARAARERAEAAGVEVVACPAAPAAALDLLARSALLVTDDASLAFDAALLEIAVVHVVPDVRLDGRPRRAGWFDVHVDGFGPVASTPDDVALAVADALAAGRPVEPYATRMAEAFRDRDGLNAQRVYRSVRAMDTPLARRLASPGTFT